MATTPEQLRLRAAWTVAGGSLGSRPGEGLEGREDEAAASASLSREDGRPPDAGGEEGRAGRAGWWVGLGGGASMGGEENGRLEGRWRCGAGRRGDEAAAVALSGEDSGQPDAGGGGVGLGAVATMGN
jgi:hypothetical protein